MTPLMVRMVMGLSSVHVWGVDGKTDEAVLRMVQEIAALEISDPRSALLGQLAQTNIHQGISLTQGALIGPSDALTVEFPNSIHSPKVGSLWRSDAVFVSARLVFMVAVSKQLMHESLNEVLCSTCSILATMYAIQFLQRVPECMPPSLGVIVDMWDDPVAVLQETAHVLLASVTDLPMITQELQQTDKSTLIGSSEMRTILNVAQRGAAINPETLWMHQSDVSMCRFE